MITLRQKKDSYSVAQDRGSRETECRELCKEGLSSSTSQRRWKMMETLFKLRTHFEGSQIWILHTSTFKTFWSWT